MGNQRKVETRWRPRRKRIVGTVLRIQHGDDLSPGLSCLPGRSSEFNDEAADGRCWKKKLTHTHNHTTQPKDERTGFSRRETPHRRRKFQDEKQKWLTKKFRSSSSSEASGKTKHRPRRRDSSTRSEFRRSEDFFIHSTFHGAVAMQYMTTYGPSARLLVGGAVRCGLKSTWLLFRRPAFWNCRPRVCRRLLAQCRPCCEINTFTFHGIPTMIGQFLWRHKMTDISVDRFYLFFYRFLGVELYMCNGLDS